MKGLTKVLLGAAFVFGLIGGAFCIAGLCLGFGSGDFGQIVESGKSYVQEGQFLSEIRGRSGSTEKDKDFSGTYRGIEALEIDISRADCVLIPGEEDRWEVSGYDLPSGFKCTRSGDTLRIQMDGGTFFPWNFTGKTGRIEIAMPADAALDRFELDCGVGEVTMGDSMLACREADIECGVGSCSLNMDIGKELKIECGIGSVSLMLKGAEKDFACDLRCGIGEIRVGDTFYSRAEGKVKTASGRFPGKKIKAESGVGEIEIDFDETDR